jgi:hypothetical protein
MCVEGSHHLEHTLFLLLVEDLFEFGNKKKSVTYGCRASVLDNLSWVNGVGEDLVELVYEGAVVDLECAVSGAVPVEQLRGLYFGQSDTKGAEAGAELGRKEGLV